MLEHRHERFALAQVVWMAAALLALVALGRFVIETYFVLSFVGLLVAMQLYAPTGEPPAWWRPLRLFVLVCFLLLGYLVYRRFTMVA